ncbi:MAG TPA: SMP-30/gluconolactonase/LRE family protein [Dehalococcoidia bacterium]|mgnify:FL=1|nr:gluconolaconase [Dehalococcoidia bacterium]HHZ61622.1 SMP-30/gluconolactonase/LRE family protein [Dehalococcoidia bacterium]HIA16033.1 SMP-30/gluconolactonase/LRE family protein [Dehalococcoidia bacterium]HIM90400.1 SMP-30/gluconolactonase/LRE family protein [Dehalococcoidia bacterium]HIO63880.1 SMP-30/gluconolactonase/LRE family protein [Dehalococcoidia bacterium]
MVPELMADYRCETGEGPLWHPMERQVYWSDIPRGRIFRLNPFSRRHEQIYEGRIVGGYTIQSDGSLLLFMDRGSVAVWRDGKLKYLVNEMEGETDNRFNDVAADPAGRVFCGTMPTDTRSATLYRMDTDGSVTTVLEGVGLSNGIGFSPDQKQMYYTDSLARKIYIFDYDIDSGDITNQRVFVETPDDGSIPDGMTVDAEGYVWGARWDGSSLYRYNPDGEQVVQIQFPAKKVSSVIFGGVDLTDMYVTTAGGGNKAEEGPGAGGLFRLNVGIQGKPEFLSRVGLS